MKTRFFKTLMLAAIFITVGSCDLDDGDNYYPNPDVAYGVIANASPDSDDLFFYADSNNINSSPLNYTDAAGYSNFYTGDRTFSIEDGEGHQLATVEKTIARGEFISIFAVNNVADIELVVYDDMLENPALNHAMVRFINLSPDAPAIDINSDEEIFAEGLEFKQATDFIEIEGGTYTITYTDPADATLYTDTDVTFHSGRIYTIYTKGYVTPPVGSDDTFSTKRMTNY